MMKRFIDQIKRSRRKGQGSQGFLRDEDASLAARIVFAVI
jgi:hypothetical protein